jgi:hypothetical protein
MLYFQDKRTFISLWLQQVPESALYSRRVLQTNNYSCGIFASVRLQFWCIHRRFPTAAEFTQNDDDRFRLYMVRRLLQYHSKGSRSHLYLLNNRKRIVHDLTEDKKNISIDLTTEEIDILLL